jgi:hypothetical protein
MISSLVGLLGGLWTALGGMFQVAEDGDRGQQIDPDG